MYREALESLTDRERELLRLVAAGLQSQEIGTTVGLAPGTVDKHLYSARQKLGGVPRRRAAHILCASEDRQAVGSQSLSIAEMPPCVVEDPSHQHVVQEERASFPSRHSGDCRILEADPEHHRRLRTMRLIISTAWWLVMLITTVLCLIAGVVSVALWMLP